MRVNFKYIGLFILMIFSFYFTNKVYELALDTDIIMKKIKMSPVGNCRKREIR